jgi:hypothetical protein
MTVVSSQIQTVDFFQLGDLRQRLRAERLTAFEGMQHDASIKSPSEVPLSAANALSTLSKRASRRTPV